MNKNTNQRDQRMLHISHSIVACRHPRDWEWKGSQPLQGEGDWTS